MIDTFIDPSGPIALAQRDHLIEVVTLTMIAVLPVIILVPLILWRYRSSNSKADYAPAWDRSKWIELLIWGVPFAIITILSVLLWRSTSALDPYQPVGKGNPLRIEVIGLDWKWLFIYPELNIATVGELAFPVEESVALQLTSDTVMQSFYVPALAGQIYVMPGMQTELHFAAGRRGEFLGLNTQYSGSGFHDQSFRAVALSDEDFRAWAAAVRAQSPALNAGSYAQLARRGSASEAQATFSMTNLPSGTLRFRLDDANLFTDILARYRSGAAVPPRDQPGSPAYNPQPAADVP